MRIVTPGQMRAIDKRAIEELGIPAAVLMENAGGALAEQAAALLGGRTGPVAVACGPGNNGGDGFSAARQLHGRGYEVVLLLAAGKGRFAGDARRHLAMAASSGVPVLDISTPARLARALPVFGGAALVVDALFGTGLARGLSGHLADVVEAINASPAPVMAADVPSGLDGATGLPAGAVVAADLTVAFGYPKTGLFLAPGWRYAGEVVVADIGIPAAAEEGIDLPGTLIDEEAVEAAFPPRLGDSHKGDFGHLLVVAGSAGKVGAGVLAACGALRAGAGLVTIAVPASAVHVPACTLPEAMTAPLPETAEGTLAFAGKVAAERLSRERDALAIGPGLGNSEETARLVKELLAAYPGPAVVDADALNAMGNDLAFLRPRGGRTVLTPHPGEMARLLGVSAAEVQADRLGAAVRCAAESGCVVVLKGARTVVALPDGRWFLNPTGNPGMATAGTGDVLTGMIGALLARGVEAGSAACAAVFLHGRAGDLAAAAASEESMTARDLADHLGSALRGIREGEE